MICVKDWRPAEMCPRGQVFGLEDPRGQNALASAIESLALASAIKSMITTLETWQQATADTCSHHCALSTGCMHVFKTVYSLTTNTTTLCQIIFNGYSCCRIFQSQLHKHYTAEHTKYMYASKETIARTTPRKHVVGKFDQ